MKIPYFPIKNTISSDANSGNLGYAAVSPRNAVYTETAVLGPGGVYTPLNALEPLEVYDNDGSWGLSLITLGLNYGYNPSTDQFGRVSVTQHETHIGMDVTALPVEFYDGGGFLLPRISTGFQFSNSFDGLATINPSDGDLVQYPIVGGITHVFNPDPTVRVWESMEQPKPARGLYTKTLDTVPAALAYKLLDADPQRKALSIRNNSATETLLLSFDDALSTSDYVGVLLPGADNADFGSSSSAFSPLMPVPTNEIWALNVTGANPADVIIVVSRYESELP